LSFDIVSIGELTWTIDSDPDGIINSANQTGSVLEVSVQTNGSATERIAVIKSNLNDTITIIQNA
jgi:beta-glucanase (GH16 family)